MTWTKEPECPTIRSKVTNGYLEVYISVYLEDYRYQGNISYIDGSDERNGKELLITEAEEIKKWWREYTEELYKKGINDPDNNMVESLT